jgi:hypothetical protein
MSGSERSKTAVSQTHSYQKVWQDAQRVDWRVRDLINPTKPLDFTKPFLPESLVRTDDISCLNSAEKLALNHVRGCSYLHLFVLVEQFIIPTVLEQVKRLGFDDIFATQALLGFAEEEGKHIHLFQEFAIAFEQGFGHSCDRLESTATIASKILAHHPLSVLLLTLQFEWTTQNHYLESIRENDEDDLDPRFCDLLKHHWMEEAQHTKLDTLLIYDLADRLGSDVVNMAIAGYFQLVHLLHDALMEQVNIDLVNLERAVGHGFSASERQEILDVQQQAYRWAFLCSGLTHPNFVKVLTDLNPTGKVRVTELAKGWS